MGGMMSGTIRALCLGGALALAAPAAAHNGRLPANVAQLEDLLAHAYGKTLERAAQAFPGGVKTHRK
jgi:hypothetical protein